jgi:cyclic pyranopterin phosphate synthase
MEKDLTVDYLRFSLTDRCNLNCIYCSPLKKSQFLGRDEVLRYEEIVKAVSFFAKAGIKKLRLTGGEPLIKRDLVELIKMLKGIKGLEEIAMTTNGVYLDLLADELKKAGLDRVNVSLDTLKKEKFRHITGSDHFDDVWAGIERSIETGLQPVKLNVILMKGINDDEITDFARLTLKRPLTVRFIELFPTNKRSHKLAGSLIEGEDVRKKISGEFGEIDKISGVRGNGPAEYYKIKDSTGAIGFISNASRDFCGECNRIRVDCAGRVSPCLFSGYIYDLRPLLRDGSGDDKLLAYLKNILSTKYDYNKKKAANRCGIEMSTIGG